MLVDMIAGGAVVLLTYFVLRRFGPNLSTPANWTVIVGGQFFRTFFRELAGEYVWFSLLPPVMLGAQWWAGLTLYRNWRDRKRASKFGATLERPTWQNTKREGIHDDESAQV